MISAILLTLASLVWFLYQRRKARRKPRPPKIVNPASNPKAYLRGLLAFEKGESLLGRDSDVGRLLAVIYSPEFTFGYVSGDAGVGKTSLLRAGILSQAPPPEWLAVYVPRPTLQPVQAITKCLLQGIPNVPGDGTPKNLTEAFAAVSKATSKTSILLILDQFEEFFLAFPTRPERLPILEELAESTLRGNLFSGRILVCLRREFVDDLHDFVPFVAQPTDDRFRCSLNNWTALVASHVLATIVEHDSLPFSEELIDSVVRDLAHHDMVRPVELQIVCTRLRDEGISDLPRYKQSGRAEGLLASYVRDRITPRLQSDEAKQEFDIARLILRSLCSETRNAKRATGLTISELSDRIQLSLPEGSEKLRNVPTTVRTVLQRLLDAYLVVPEDEDKYNLIHDYIVRPILFATSDVSPVEERANRLLERFLEEYRGDLGTRIPLKQSLFIRKFASQNERAKPQAVELLHKSYRKAAFVYVGWTAAIVAALLTAAFPPRVQVIAEAKNLEGGQWTVASHRTAAIYKDEKGSTFQWVAGSPSEVKAMPGISVQEVRVSPDGKIVLLRSGNGIAETETASGATRQIMKNLWPAVQGKHDDEPKTISMVFSPASDVAFFIDPEGGLYRWRPVSPKVEGPVPLRPDQNPSVAKKPEGDDENDTGCYFDTFSRRGKWFYVSCGPRGPNYLLETYPNNPASGVGAHILPHDIVSLSFSDDESHMLVVSHLGTMTVVDLHAFKATAFPSDIKEEVMINADASLSPDGRWAVFAPGLMFSLSYPPRLVNTAKPEASLHLVDPKANDAVDFEGDQGFARIAFSPDSKWLFGIHDNGTVYRWHLPGDPITDNIVLEHDRVLTKVPWENMGLVFSPDSQWVIASDRQHYLYSWKVNERPYLGAPLAQQDDKGTILWTKNGKSLISFGGSFVYYGTPDRPLRQIFRAPTPVMDIAVSPDKKQLILFCRNQLISLKREIRLWGFIRLRRLEWDDLEQAHSS